MRSYEWVDSRARVRDQRGSPVGDSLGCRSLPNTPISLRSERRALAVLGQHIGRMLDGADCVQKGLDGAFDLSGWVGQR
jgi:hypothetical protein